MNGTNLMTSQSESSDLTALPKGSMMAPMETQPNAKVVVHRHPPANPGKCVVCGFGGGDDRVYIDFGFDIDYYGAVYFCSFCMVEVANAVGYVSADQYDRMKIENMKLHDDIRTALDERNGATNALRAYLNGTGAVGAVAESEELPRPKQAVKQSAGKKPSPKPKPSSDVKESGPNDSSADDGDTISLPGF